jgi:hypothetical protein
MGFLLLYIAWVLLLPLTILNWFFVKRKKGYFRSTAINIDVFANKEFRTLWNKLLITESGYKFGEDFETISSVLGKNILKKTLTATGKVLVFLLTKKHCIKSIKNEKN